MSERVIDDLQARRLKLENLKREVENELASIMRGLYMAGAVVKRGRPLIAPTHTVTQAREAHRRYALGERDEWVTAGERQYQRESKRAKRQDGAA